MKKRIVAALALMLIAALALGGCTKIDASGTLSVGVTDMGESFVEGFGLASENIEAKTLIHGFCDIYERDDNGELVFNTAAFKEYVATLDEQGNKTFTFTLRRDCSWNNGSRITAKDYCFAVLLHASPEYSAAGADTDVGNGILGYDAYHSGETSYFAGVSYISEYEFSLTLAAEVFPDFYATQRLAFGPVCAESYAPGCSIETGAAGSKIVGTSLTELCTTVAAGERLKPTVTCGPYKFVSCAEGRCELEVNKHFAGDLAQRLPSIANIALVSTPQAELADKVMTGTLDLACGITDLEQIKKITANADVRNSFYTRNGYGALIFHCDFGPTADANVRNALARLIDRNNLVGKALFAFGTTVDAEYSPSLWQYKSFGNLLEGKLAPINPDIAAANDYLDLTEWKYERDGKTPFDPSKANAQGGYLRYNAQKTPLTIYHAGSNAEVADALETEFADKAPLAGVKVVCERVAYDALRSQLYFGYDQGDARKYNSFAVGFNIPDPYVPYETLNSVYIGTRQNINQLTDSEIDRLSLALIEIDASERDKYGALWAEYQIRWNALMPSVPLYTDYIYNVYAKGVDGVALTSATTFADIICAITLTEGGAQE